MTKFQEAIETYKSFMTDKLNMSQVNQDILIALAEMLGPNIYDADASLVACSDKAELSRVKEMFLIGELGLTEKPELDKAIKAVCTEMGTSNRKKFRVVFYYLLLQQFGLENRFTKGTTQTEAKTVKTKADTKTKTTEIKADAVETKKTTVKTTIISAAPAKTSKKVTTGPVFNSFDETYNFYTDYLYNEVAFFDVQPDLLSNLINTAGENSVVDITAEAESIKNNFLKGRLGCDESPELYNAIQVVNERMANSPKYRPIFYYLLTKHLGKEWVITQPAVANLY